MNQEKPSLPSIKDLLEGGPGLIDYSQHNSDNTKKSRHRRHASEHITGSSHHSFRSPAIPPPPLPPLPSSSASYDSPEKPSSLLPNQQSSQNQEHTASIHAATLPFEMQSLSLEKKPEPLALKNLLLESSETDESIIHTHRRRTHSRSYSDFTHPYSPFNKNQNDTMNPPTNNRTTPLQTGKLPIAPTPLSLMPIRPKFHSPELEDKVLAKPEDEEPKDPPIVYKQPFSKTIMNHHEQPAIETTNNNSVTKYICPYCSKGFTRPSSLRTHTYSHTGEKPFPCTEPGCGRKFSVQSNLRRHLRVHRTKKPSTVFLSKNIH